MEELNQNFANQVTAFKALNQFCGDLIDIASVMGSSDSPNELPQRVILSTES